MVTILLGAGESPNIRFNDATVWIRFLLHLRQFPTLGEDAEIVDITKSLIQSGADLRTIVKRTEDYIVPARRPKTTGRSSDLFKQPSGAKKGTRVPRVEQMKVEEILEEVFGIERMQFIMSAQPPEKTAMWQKLQSIWSGKPRPE